MDWFRYRDRALYCEDVPVADLAAEYGTPLFIYSQATLLYHLGELQRAFAPAEPLICYSLKTNPNVHIGRLMAEGIGFGGEGDWKTSILVRTLKTMAAGLPGGTSFMEDYTYHLRPGQEVPYRAGAAFLGVAFFVKYSFDNNLISPELRVAIGFLAGIGLLVGGVLLHRRQQYMDLSQPATLRKYFHQRVQGTE